jgi:hypothetical protein
LRSGDPWDRNRHCIWVILNEMLFLDCAWFRKRLVSYLSAFVPLQVSSSSVVLKTGFDFLDNW